MKKLNFIILATLLFLCSKLSFATVIIPPSDVGQMLYDSEFVVYGTVISHNDGNVSENVFEVKRNIKGGLSEGDRIIIDEYGKKTRLLDMRISGDTNYKIGSNYLLFLFKTDNGHFKSRLLAMSVFEEVKVAKQRVLAHESSYRSLSIVGHETDLGGISGVYNSESFLNHLSSISDGSANWNELTAGITSLRIEEEEDSSHQNEVNRAECPNDRPVHCTTLIGDATMLGNTCTEQSPAKFVPPAPCTQPAFEVRVSADADDDPDTNNELTMLQTAVTEMNNMQGLTVTYEGVAACPVTAGCTNAFDEAAQCLSTILAPELWVFLNDPCNQIDDLTNCSGTLAIGGGGGLSFENGDPACHTDCCGNVWRAMGVPFFVMNNGAFCVGEYTYTAVYIHEMLHSIGLDHIDAGMACTALMNPVVCNANSTNMTANFGITALDTDCTDWMYNASPIVPVELEEFILVKKGAHSLLKWSTASETNNAFFTVERSSERRSWETIAKVNGAGNSAEKNTYSAYDLSPSQGINYYRIKQTDYNGDYSYSDVKSIEFEREGSIILFPNPVHSGEIYISGLKKLSQNASILIYDLNGKLMDRRNLKNDKGSLDISMLDNGTYFLEIRNQGKVHTEKIMVLR